MEELMTPAVNRAVVYATLAVIALWAGKLISDTCCKVGLAGLVKLYEFLGRRRPQQIE